MRTFTAHGAQLAAIAVRPLISGYSRPGPTDEIVTHPSDQQINESESATSSNHAPSSSARAKEATDSDTKSDASFDPLFDDEPEDQQGSLSTGAPNPQQQPPKATSGMIPPPKNAPPLLDSVVYSTYSPDLLMTASIDGQIIIWDRRIDTLGSGVGRLWMSEKTPPWCLSVNALADVYRRNIDKLTGMLVGRRRRAPG